MPVLPRILLLNDLHLEFQPYVPASEGYDIAVLAGDIHTRERGVEWAQKHFSCPVVYVAGNHEGYGTHWENNLKKMKDKAAGSHVVVLDRESVVIQGVRFLGATSWTTFETWPDRGEAMTAAGSGRDFYGAGMRDYRLIRTAGYRRLVPTDTARWAHATRRWLEQEFAQPFEGPTVVVTHHAPSVRSLEGGKAVNPLDAADANPWDDLVAASGAALWLHGHTHHPVDYWLGGTRVGSNPRGYPGQDLAHRPDGIWIPDGRPSLDALPTPRPR